MSIKRHKLLLAILLILFLFSNYLYIFRFIETLFWIHDLDQALIGGAEVESHRAYKEIYPSKIKFFFLQIGLSLLMFLYGRQLKNQNILMPFSTIIYVIGVFFLIIYFFVGLLGSMTPYSGVIG